MNALRPQSQSHVVSHRQYTGSDRKLGAGTQHKIYKDSCRCQGHYLHGYRILQHQVQIKFLEASSVSLAFPWMYEVVAAEALSQQHSELAAAVVLLLGFFIICCWPANSLGAVIQLCVTLNVWTRTGEVQLYLVHFSVPDSYSVGISWGVFGLRVTAERQCERETGEPEQIFCKLFVNNFPLFRLPYSKISKRGHLAAWKFSKNISKYSKTTK